MGRKGSNLLRRSIPLVHGLPLFHLVRPAGPDFNLVINKRSNLPDNVPLYYKLFFQKSLKKLKAESSDHITATVAALPGALYVDPPSGPKNSVRFRVFPFPPRPFFPAESGCQVGEGKHIFCYQVQKKVCFVSEKKKPTFRGHLAVPACARKGRELARGDPRLLLKTWFLIYSC